ncbi:MAG: hypothetical protein HUU37_05745 [Bdellovibrionales bacterium]|nr:hypothetical protein [Bdellovibrionales bacterium]
MQSPDLLAVFLAPLEKSGIPYFVTGSIASIFYGEPRLTHDIDIVIHLSQDHLAKFSSLFPLEEFYCPPEEVIQIENKRRPFGHFNLIHHASGFKADIYPDAGDELHQWAFQSRRRVDLGTSALWLAPPEYVVIRKLEYFREGGSEKHLEDIRKMLLQVEGALDHSFLEREIEERDLSKYWKRIRKA